jgi:hypothetical protein
LRHNSLIGMPASACLRKPMICSYMDASQVASALCVGCIGGLHYYIRPVYAGVVARWP